MYICIETVLEGCAYTPVDNSHQLPLQAIFVKETSMHEPASTHQTLPTS